MLDKPTNSWNILNSYTGVWHQIICVCNTIIAETWKCKLQKNANEAFPRLEHFEHFYPRSVYITTGDGKCKMYLRWQPLLYTFTFESWTCLKFEVWAIISLRFVRQKIQFKVTTKMFICCVPQYWVTGPHPCLHPLYAAAVIKGQSSVHPPPDPPPRKY